MAEAKKKREADRAAGINKAGGKGGFRDFLANQKKTKDKAEGWAMDFGNPNQEAGAIGAVKVKKEDGNLEKAIEESLKIS